MEAGKKFFEGHNFFLNIIIRHKRNFFIVRKCCPKIKPKQCTATKRMQLNRCFRLQYPLVLFTFINLYRFSKLSHHKGFESDKHKAHVLIIPSPTAFYPPRKFSPETTAAPKPAKYLPKERPLKIPIHRRCLKKYAAPSDTSARSGSFR